MTNFCKVVDTVLPCSLEFYLSVADVMTGQDWTAVCIVAFLFGVAVALYIDNMRK